MIHDVIERFRYRFQLWHRERREDLFGMPRTDRRSLREWEAERLHTTEPDKMNDPSYAAVVVESTANFVVRSIGVYFGVIIILAQLCRWLVSYFPSTRSAVLIVFLVLVGFWTLGMILCTLDFCRKR